MGRLTKDKRDVYYREAKIQGYRARSAFKLIQIDETLGLLDGVRNVADLCAAPGGWSQVLAQRLLNVEDADSQKARIVAVDKYPMEPIEGVVQVEGDITHTSTAEAVLGHFGGERADLVVCDGAPDITFRVDFDEYVQHQLLLSELSLATMLLRPGGAFVAKVFRGENIGTMYAELQRFFSDVICCKPRASRNSSQEVFVACRGFVPQSDSPRFERNCDTCTALSVRFVACGGPDALDSDRSYPISADHKLLKPLAPPIDAPFREALEDKEGRRRLGKAAAIQDNTSIAPDS